MRHRIDQRKLNRPTDQRIAMLRTMTADFFRHESMRTTEAKAKEVRRMAEKVITLGKDNTLQARREALRVVRDPSVVKKVFDEIAPRFSTRPGGYTRIIKLGNRLGDAAPMAQLELVDGKKA